MTSTSFNVGVNSEAKSSSRVLRPPGGGHTDIFSAEEPIAPVIRKEDRRNASSILEGKNVEPPQSVPTCKVEETVKKQPEAVTEIKSSVVQEKAAAPRGRVPPGGFSSGLW